MTPAPPSSERLVAELPSLAEHLDFITALYAEPEIARWHWPGHLGGTRNAEESREILLSAIAHQEADGLSFWVWRERSSGDLVARVGLSPALVDGEMMIEVGWSVPAAFQGRGYATEAAKASIDFGLGVHGLDEIISFTMVENAASRRVMEKSGLAYRRDFVHAGLPHALYATAAAAPGQA